MNINERLTAAHYAIEAHRIADNDHPSCYSNEENVTDLLADLLHFCTAERLDFDNALRRARMHCEAEQAGF